MNDKIIFELVSSIKNQRLSSIELGHGSFLLLDFGKIIERNVKTKRGIECFSRGEWRLWLYMCEWRIEKRGKLLCHSENERDAISKKIMQLKRNVLIDFNITSNKFDALLKFTGDICVKIIIDKEEDGENWNLFTPDGRVLVIGPKEQWKIISENKD